MNKKRGCPIPSQPLTPAAHEREERENQYIHYLYIILLYTKTLLPTASSCHTIPPKTISHYLNNLSPILKTDTKPSQGKNCRLGHAPHLPPIDGQFTSNFRADAPPPETAKVGTIPAYSMAGNEARTQQQNKPVPGGQSGQEATKMKLYRNETLTASVPPTGDQGSAMIRTWTRRPPEPQPATAPRVPIAHASAEDVTRGRTEADSYEMRDHAGRPTTDLERAVRVFALDSEGQTLAIFATGRKPPFSFATGGKITAYKQGANLEKRTIRQQCFAFPAGPQLQLF